MGSDNDNDNDQSCSESESSDIGNLLAKASTRSATKRRRYCPNRDTNKNIKDYGDDDDDDDEEGEDDDYYNAIQSLGNRRGRPRSKSSVEHRLASLEQKKILYDNQRLERSKTAVNDSDDDDDFDDEYDKKNNSPPSNKENMISQFQSLRGAGTTAKTTTSAIDLTETPPESTKKHACYDDDDDDYGLSSDDEKPSRIPQPPQRSGASYPASYNSNNPLPMWAEGMDPQLYQQLMKAREAQMRLRRAQAYNAEDVLQAQAQAAMLLQQQQQQQALWYQQQQLAALSLMAQQQRQVNQQMPYALQGAPWYPHPMQTLPMMQNIAVPQVRVLQLDVTTEIEVVDGSERTKKQTVKLNMRADEPFSVLNQRLIEALQLGHRGKGVLASFKYGTQTLQSTRTPEWYKFPNGRTKLRAKIILSPISLTSSSSKVLGGSGNAASSKKSWGKPLCLVIRVASSSEKHTVQHGAKQPFQDLVETALQKVQSSSGNRNNIKLVFDGEALNLAKTPLDYDMEDEDMVDVIGV
ncbi:hypothetical protein ACA910_013987 [Epithemia clementina (nom. ined.)]